MNLVLASQNLYRYRSLDGDGLHRTEQIVRESKLNFASPAAFNDPFDCRPTFSLDGNPAEVNQYFAGLYKRQAPHLDRSERRAEIRKHLKDPSKTPNNPEALRRFSNFYYENISGKAGLLCLTEKPDDLLMWSHYASSHTGVCLGFRKDAEFFAVAQPVLYSKSRPTVNPIRQKPEQMLDLALYTKAKHWEYEAEWRIVNYRGGPGVYIHPPADLRCIIFGSRISDANRQAVRQWIVSRLVKPTLYQASLSETTFALSIALAHETS